MPNAELQGKVGLDINPFLAGLRRLRGVAEPAGAFIGRQFKSGFLRFFGAGAVIAVAQKSIRDAAEIRREAAKLDMDVETYQALQQISQRYGHSVDDLTEKILRNSNATAQQKRELLEMIDDIKKSGSVIDAAKIDELAHLYDVFQRLFVQLAPMIATGMTFLIRVIDVLKNVAKDAVAQVKQLITLAKNMDIVGMYKFLTGKAEALFPGGLGYLDDLLKFWKDSEAALKASQGKDKPRKLVLPEKEDRHNLYKAQVDALQRVGGYIFGSPAQVLMGRQNRQLEKIEARLVEIKTSITGQLSN